MAESEIAQHVERPAGGLRAAEPQAIAELHGGRDAGEPRRRLGQQVLVLRGRQEPARILEQDAAQLPRFLQRRQSVDEVIPHGVEELEWQVLRVHTRLFRHLSRQRLDQSLGESSHLGWLAGHEGVRLEVEAEVRRGPLGPEPGVGPFGERVVARVHLDDGELVRVVAQAVLGRGHPARIEDVAARHRRVGPRGGADADLPRGVEPAAGRRHGEPDLFGGRSGQSPFGTDARLGEAGVVRRVEVRCGEVGGGSAGHGSAGQLDQGHRRRRAVLRTGWAAEKSAIARTFHQ